MGRKVNPIGFRLKINKTWEGRWFAEGREYVDQLHQDFALRDLVRRKQPGQVYPESRSKDFPEK